MTTSCPLQLLKPVKLTENLKTIPVVALTSSCQRADLIEFYKHGVNDYVVKPVDFNESMKVMKQLVGFCADVNKPPTPARGE